MCLGVNVCPIRPLALIITIIYDFEPKIFFTTGGLKEFRPLSNILYAIEDDGWRFAGFGMVGGAWLV